MIAQLALFRSPVIVAWRDTDKGMVPVTDNGTLATFETPAQGRDAAGLLGCACPVSWARVLEICKRFGLEVPE